ncbi:hypothetical protein MHPYR_770012 [uncultured Mycobacterium sp.]|uniref:Ribbon-helix-helix protein CopG domain-containing protein n=1 Tax=uncultured Mycobacterium sp. TaxID=171292 RepID=A0A1Y5PL68_9MYCO|nr:hypothetical protein MHPYR_770012 [uncultured Mycobacterium sp.]
MPPGKRHNIDGAEGVNVSRVKSETRQLTEGVFVRFRPSDYDEIRQEADRRGISVAQLLRESTLSSVRSTSLRAS